MASPKGRANVNYITSERSIPWQPTRKYRRKTP